MWLAVAQLLSYALKYIAEKQLLDAGAAKIIAANAQKSLDAIASARRAVDSVRNDPDSVRNDPDNRDNSSQ